MAVDVQLFTDSMCTEKAMIKIQQNQHRCFEKRKVLSFSLNVSRVPTPAGLMSVGRAFRRRGGAEPKARSPT